MAVHVAIEHRTAYGYDRPVRLAPHVVRLHPAPHSRTAVIDYEQQVAPAGHTVSWQHDPFGNRVARYVFQEPAEALEVVVRFTARLDPVNPFDFLLEPAAGEWPVPYAPAVARALLPSLETAPLTVLEHEFLAAARALAGAGRTTTDVLVDCNQLVHDTIAYETRLEPGVQSPQETLSRGIGSCRDQVWLLVHVLRHLGLAARFTSGYLLELAEDDGGVSGGGDEQDDGDTVALHAWAETYLPGAGWVGLDPTSALLATEVHIPLASASEPSLAAPIEGTAERAASEFTHDSTVTRLPDTPGGGPQPPDGA